MKFQITNFHQSFQENQSRLAFAPSHRLYNKRRDGNRVDRLRRSTDHFNRLHTLTQSRSSGGEEVIRVHAIYASWQLYNTNLHFADRQK